MFKGIKKAGFAALIAIGMGSQAIAQTPGCIVLKTVVEVEQVTVNAKGEKSTKLVPAGKVVPGVEVIYTVTANNTCKEPTEKVTIHDAVPEHMAYVASSASGPGTDITYSLDGKTFGTADQLTVQENGATRKARADEYKHIRWTFKDSLQPGAHGFGRYRAVLN